MSINKGSVLSNYSATYEAWNSYVADPCPECHGTGLDRDEIYDCLYCGGEGEIVPPEAVLNAPNVRVDVGPLAG